MTRMKKLVSRGVVRRAPCAVLVVRRALRDVRHIAVGFDDSAHARRAVELISSLSHQHAVRPVSIHIDDLKPIAASLEDVAGSRHSSKASIARPPSV